MNEIKTLEIQKLEILKDRVTTIYSLTEGVNEELSKKALIDLLSHVSLSVEVITGLIDSYISIAEGEWRWKISGKTKRVRLFMIK